MVTQKTILCMGILVACLAASAHAEHFCKEYVSEKTVRLDTEEDTTVRSAIKVPDAFDVTSVRVSFNLTYTRLGALKLNLQSVQPKSQRDGDDWRPLVRSAKLMARMGRKQSVLNNIEFSDDALETYPTDPMEMPPSHGSFQPMTPFYDVAYGVSKFAGEGGSRGWWRIVLADVGNPDFDRAGSLNGWKLTLCGNDLAADPPAEFVMDQINAFAGTDEGVPMDYDAELPVSDMLIPSTDSLDNTVDMTYEAMPVIAGNYSEALNNATITDDVAGLPLENSYVDDAPIRYTSGGGILPPWEIGWALLERMSILLGFRLN
jgi:subtilisin-like proprotein convertase family protein